MRAPTWIPIDEALDVVTSPEWSWMRNSRCKYLSIRLDTRNGLCLLYDRHGASITLDDLRHQHNLSRG